MQKAKAQQLTIVRADIGGYRHNVSAPVPVAVEDAPKWVTPLWISMPTAVIFLAIAIYAFVRAEPPAHIGGSLALFASACWWLIAAQEIQFCVVWNDPAVTQDGTDIDDWSD